MDLSVAGVVAIIGLTGAAAGTVVGSKIAVSLLQRAHERFEDAVWKAIESDREKAERVRERITKIEAVCDLRNKEGAC